MTDEEIFPAHTTDLARLDAWTRAAQPRGTLHAVRIGCHALDASLVQRWVLDCARVATGPIVVRAAETIREPVRFEGSGWAAVVMPTTLAADDLTDLEVVS